MYNCLIVDDETIILSGIKFLIDWEKNDCAIMDTARNGRDALEKSVPVRRTSFYVILTCPS